MECGQGKVNLRPMVCQPLSLFQMYPFVRGYMCRVIHNAHFPVGSSFGSPPGARVWPVQSHVWLDTVIDFEIEGKMREEGSKTDYLFLTQKGWDHFDSLCKQGVTIVGDHILEILPLII